MSEHHLYAVKPEIAKNAHIDAETYRRLYQQSIADPETFWAQQATQFL
ncbi:MAG: acetyl-coenzyme A synthetase N-terminal domain-containing protein, partial [Methylomonas sp.]